MTVTIELTASDFYTESWSGGRDTCDELSLEEIQTILDMLDDPCGSELMSLTDVNDFFWFERDTIANWLGYSDFDELMNREEEE